MSDVTLLVDANVLIDYQKSDLSVFRHVSNTLGRVVVLDNVLEEVEGLTNSDCQRVEVDVIMADMDLLLRAGEPTTGISFQDRLCILVCKRYGYVCVTNDRALHKQCQTNGVQTKYGLRLMIELVEARAINVENATAIALKMQESNPQHINDQLISRFRQLCAEAEQAEEGIEPASRRRRR